MHIAGLDIWLTTPPDYEGREYEQADYDAGLTLLMENERLLTLFSRQDIYFPTRAEDPENFRENLRHWAEGHGVIEFEEFLEDEWATITQMKKDAAQKAKEYQNATQ